MRARLLSVAAGAFIVLTFSVVRLAAVQRGPGDEEEIRRLIDAHAAASQRGDLSGLAHPSDTIHIRFLRPDVAFVDVDSVPGGGTGQAGTVHAGAAQAGAPPPVSRTPLFVVFTKEQGKWGVAVQRSGVRLQ